MTIYQELIDADFAETELEQRIGEGWTLEQIREDAAERGYFDE